MSRLTRFIKSNWGKLLVTSLLGGITVSLPHFGVVSVEQLYQLTVLLSSVIETLGE